MKMNKETLLRIFAAYWGAKVTGYFNGGFVVADFMKYASKSAHQLLLKNLSDITDEDAIEVAKKVFPESFNSKGSVFTVIRTKVAIKIATDKAKIVLIIAHKCNIAFQDMTDFSDFFNPSGEPIYIPVFNSIPATDFLRSKSYNIGYGEYSPQQLIDLGIVKIIDNI